MKKGTLILIVITIFLLGGVSFLVRSLKANLIDFPIKSLAEEKLSSLLGAQVSVDEINFGLVRQVSLSGLSILSPENEPRTFYLAGAKAISFRYNFLQLLSRDFRSPHRVILDSPRILLKSFQFPEKLFKGPSQPVPTNFLTKDFQLMVRGGRVDYPFLENKYKIGLKDIGGIVTPHREGGFEVKLSARGTGVFRGDIKITGKIYPGKKSYDLKIQFKNKGEIFLPGFLKLKKISGNFSLRPNEIQFERIRFALADLLFESRGKISNFESIRPELDLNIALLSDKFPHEIDLHLDFKMERIWGSFKSFKQSFPFQGGLFNEAGSIRISDIQTLEDYVLSADLNILENRFQFFLEQDPFRLNINISFDDWDTHFILNLEHANVFGIDLVSYAQMRLMPTEEMKRGKAWKFLGRFKTDYLILNTEPIQDLDGTFEIDHFRMQNLNLTWGKDIVLTGVLDLLAPKESTFSLNMESLDLANLKRLFLYARPKALAGVANGRIKLSGNIGNPLITGDIEISEGAFSKLSFQAAYFRFSGYYPYLQLMDSKIIKAKQDLYLEGNLNLQSSNIFQDIKAMSEDHIVLWRGVVLSENLQDSLALLSEKIKGTMAE